MSTLPETVIDIATDAASNATTTPSPSPKKEPHPLTEVVQFALIALIIVLPVRWFVAQPFIVSGASMEDTFHSSEYLIVDQLSYHFHDPKPGDVIVFRYPNNPSTFFIKRIIGVPGDTVVIDGNIVTIINDEYPNGYVLEEDYVASMAPTTFLRQPLGEREYFVMGDNRDKSSDSRAWGVLQKEHIIGRAFLRLFPVNEIGYLPGDEDRVGTRIKDVSEVAEPTVPVTSS